MSAVFNINVELSSLALASFGDGDLHLCWDQLEEKRASPVSLEEGYSFVSKYLISSVVP
jgi:hypothetical protein